MTVLLRSSLCRFPLLAAPLAFLACEAPAPGETAREKEEEEEEEEVVTLTFCQEHFGEACDRECTADTSCGQGLNCTDGKCTSLCVQDSDCGEERCTTRGRCEPSEGGNIVIDPDELIEIDPLGPLQMPACVEGEVEFEAVVPQVWMLLDRSGSMSGVLGTNTRWEAVGNVLLGDPLDSEDRGVVGNFEDQVAFGATFYTSGAATSGGCVLSLETVALARNSYTNIRARYNKLGPTGGTPTADSVAATVAVASSSDLTGGPKILVLATDGAPGACASREGTATAEVEQEVERAFALGISTFAISISSDTDLPHMQRVANVGVGLAGDADPPAPVYTAESQDDLALAFNSILADVPRSCVFELNGEVDPENAGEGTVTLAGTELGYQDADGWILKRTDQVELVGAACDQIRAGEEDLDINFPCTVFTPVVK